MVYVAISQVNGRTEFYNMVAEFGDRYEHVEYYAGDSYNAYDNASQILPHLKFAHEEDAIVYCLMHGLEYSHNIPVQINLY
jgi:hypothetical protein